MKKNDVAENVAENTTNVAAEAVEPQAEGKVRKPRKPRTPRASLEILHSADGGKTWKIVDAGNEHLDQFVDASMFVEAKGGWPNGSSFKFVRPVGKTMKVTTETKTVTSFVEV